MKIRVTSAIIIAICLLLFAFLNIWGIDAVEGRNAFEFFADSETYIMFARGRLSLSEMMQFNPNLFGPVFIVRALFTSYNLIFVLQAIIFFHSFHLITKYYNVNSYLLLFLWCISPIMLFSIVTINKEIYSVYSLCFLLAYLRNKNSSYLFIAIFLGSLVRWQLILFLIIVYILLRTKPFSKQKTLSVIVFLVVISTVVPLASGVFKDYYAISHFGQSKENGTGLFYLLNMIQSNFLGYLIAFIPKMFFELFGAMSKINRFGDSNGFYNYTIVTIQAFLYLYIILCCIYKRIKLNNELVILGLIYCIIFNLSPVFSPRYFFPLYIILSIAVSERKLLPEKNIINLQL